MTPRQVNNVIVALIALLLVISAVAAVRGQGPHRLIAKITMETQPAPTGTIRHWSFEGTGGVCSADIASPFGKVMLELERIDGAMKRLITFEPFDIGIGR